MTPNQPNKVLKAVALKYELNTSAPRVTGQGEGYVAEDRKSTRLNSSHVSESRMPSSA